MGATLTSRQAWGRIEKIWIGYLKNESHGFHSADLMWPELLSLKMAEKLSIKMRVASALFFHTKRLYLYPM